MRRTCMVLVVMEMDPLLKGTSSSSFICCSVFSMSDSTVWTRTWKRQLTLWTVGFALVDLSKVRFV